MKWIVIGILVFITLIVAFMFGYAIKKSMKYFWYHYYEEDEEFDEEDELNFKN